MNTSRALCVAAVLLFLVATPAAASLTVSLAPSPANPAAPRMGNRLSFHTVIRNTGAQPVHGLIAWISLLRTDPGQEQPMDLEDWSAHKAVSAARLEPGQSLDADWPMRLIQDGRYRVVVSLVSREEPGLVTSPLLDFTVLRKPVVESGRVLPVALGMPFLLGLVLLWRWRRRR